MSRRLKAESRRGDRWLLQYIVRWRCRCLAAHVVERGELPSTWRDRPIQNCIFGVRVVAIS